MSASTLNDVQIKKAEIQALLDDNQQHETKPHQLLNASAKMFEIIGTLQTYFKPKQTESAISRRLTNLENTCQDNLISLTGFNHETDEGNISLKSWLQSRKTMLLDDLHQLEAMVKEFFDY